MSPLIDPLMNPAFAGDVAAVARIKVVPQLLQVVCSTTGLGFSAVAHVTESHWIPCAIRDEIGFGLKPGNALQVETTICNEVRHSGHCIAIDHAEQDAVFCGHSALRTYGVQSFISVPIRVGGGHFFGTLCASDLKANRVNNPETVGMCVLFADLIGRYLDAQQYPLCKQSIAASEDEASLLREEIIEILGHDIHSPLSAINGGVEVLRMCPGKEDTVRVLDIIEKSTVRLTGLVGDVLEFVKGHEKTV